MKRILYTLILLLPLAATAQYTANDSVITGSAYANDIFYNFVDGGDVAIANARNTWDISFSTDQRWLSIRTNTSNGVQVWKPWEAITNTAAWTGTLDTVGRTASNLLLYNDPTSLDTGAFNQNIVSAADVGWGVYNPQNHITSGDSIYLIKVRDGSYYKIKFGDWTGADINFTIANLDGTGEVTRTLTRTAYSTKKAFYYDIEANQIIDKEPARTTWQLWFTRYYDVFTGSDNLQNVTGVLLNYGLRCAEYTNGTTLERVDTTGLTFTTLANEIGHNWKTPPPPAWALSDSTAYFVETQSKDVWKIIFTGFEGTSTGKYKFYKEKVLNASRDKAPAATGLAAFAIGPNPARSHADVVYDMVSVQGDVSLRITDLQGRSLYTTTLPARTGLYQHSLSLDSLAPGLYLVTLQNGQSSHTVRLIVHQ